MIKLKINSNWIDFPSDPKLVFVIVPGAGTIRNLNAYRQLEKKFNVIYFGKSGDKYDKYPDNWYVNKNVSSTDINLGGLSNLIKNHIINTNSIPSLIISGSRGSQVTIGKVWETIWRGPSIMINAGCLTTQTKIPFDVKPLFIVMENDYFKSVNSTSKVVNIYNKLSSKQTGYCVYLPNEYHMPKLVNNLENLLLLSSKFILNINKTIPINNISLVSI